jgi:hypothetical protein
MHMGLDHLLDPILCQKKDTLIAFFQLYWIGMVILKFRSDNHLCPFYGQEYFIWSVSWKSEQIEFFLVMRMMNRLQMHKRKC